MVRTAKITILKQGIVNEKRAIVADVKIDGLTRRKNYTVNASLPPDAVIEEIARLIKEEEERLKIVPSFEVEL